MLTVRLQQYKLNDTFGIFYIIYHHYHLVYISNILDIWHYKMNTFLPTLQSRLVSGKHTNCSIP